MNASRYGLFAALVVACLAAAAYAQGGGGGGGGTGGVAIEFSTAPEPVEVTISGMVTDAQTGAPIAGALVRGHIFIWANMGPEAFDKAPTAETATDAVGRYVLSFRTPLTTSGVKRGKDGACVYVGAPGYETRPVYLKEPVTLDRTDFSDTDIALARGRLVHGVVVDELNRPLEGAVVRAQNGLNGDWNHFGVMGRAVTAWDGSFELWLTREKADYTARWLAIQKDGYGWAFAWDLEKDNLGTIVVKPGATIGGQVTDTAGRPVAGCEVVASDSMFSIVARTTTDARGFYELKGLPGLPTISDFYKKKNGEYREGLGDIVVYARLDPEMSLRDGPQFKVMPEDGKTLTAETLQVGGEARVTGTVSLGQNRFALGGLLVRLDYDWDRMVPVSPSGAFEFPSVMPGKHRLTVYLPTNLRGDGGIGRAAIEVKPHTDVADIAITLDPLAEARVQIVDADGQPLYGISAGATWSKDGSGFWTQGTDSDASGWAVVYLYPEGPQYVRGFDISGGGLLAANFKKVSPTPGETIDNIRIVMTKSAAVTGAFLSSDGAPLAGKTLLVRLAYADGNETPFVIKTDEAGRFTLKDRVPPGVATLKAVTRPLEFRGTFDTPAELKPGTVTDLGAITLQPSEVPDGLDRPDVIKAEAQRLIEAIRDADYEDVLAKLNGPPSAAKDRAWQTFPGGVSYCVYTDYPSWTRWCCEHFKDNPIVSYSLGEVFKDTDGRPTVPYEIRQKDGTVLKGNLPFTYDSDGDQWYGVEGLDWHLSKEKK